MVKRVAPKASPANVEVIPDAASSNDAPQMDNQITGRSALARCVGKVKATSDISLFQKKVISRNCMVRVIDKMAEYPDSAVSISAAIENKTIAGVAAADKEAQSKVWFDTRDTRLSRLPADWLALWILGETGGALKQAKLEQTDGANPEILAHLASWATACPLNQTLPPDCRHNQTCSRVDLSPHAARRPLEEASLRRLRHRCSRLDEALPFQARVEPGEDPVVVGLA